MRGSDQGPHRRKEWFWSRHCPARAGTGQSCDASRGGGGSGCGGSGASANAHCLSRTPLVQHFPGRARGGSIPLDLLRAEQAGAARGSSQPAPRRSRGAQGGKLDDKSSPSQISASLYEDTCTLQQGCPTATS